VVGVLEVFGVMGDEAGEVVLVDLFGERVVGVDEDVFEERWFGGRDVCELYRLISVSGLRFRWLSTGILTQRHIVVSIGVGNDVMVTVNRDQRKGDMEVGRKGRRSL